MPAGSWRTTEASLARSGLVQTPGGRWEDELPALGELVADLGQLGGVDEQAGGQFRGCCQRFLGIWTWHSSVDVVGQASLDAILTASPELAAVAVCVRECAAIISERRGQDLEQRMTSATVTGEPDRDTVTARLTLPWHSGVVEGTVNRLILWNLSPAHSKVTSPSAPLHSTARGDI